MKKFCTSLKKPAKSIIDFEKNKTVPLTKEELKSHQDAKVCYICGKRILKEFAKDKHYRKVRYGHYAGKYKGAAHSICNLKCNIPNKMAVVSHNGSNYDYHFIIKDIANEFECLKIKFIDSTRFMAISLSNLVDSLAKGIHKIKCKGCNCFLEYESVKDNLIKYKCLSFNKDYSNKPDEKFKKRFKNTLKFSDNDINKLFCC